MTLLAQINSSDDSFCKATLGPAIKRASSFWQMQANSPIIIMRGQVGGMSHKKSPLLQLESGYVLKPMQSGNRGIREIAFYEAILSASAHSNTSTSWSPWTVLDLLASWLAMKKWQGDSKHEVQLLRRLAQFTPAYYGVVEHSHMVLVQPSNTTTTSSNHYVVLQDVTSPCSKACVMDIKMGTRTYEPDAPEEKKWRESIKYPQQTQMGFRIVGMRIYCPCHPNSDSLGFRTFDKSLGRSLSTRDLVLDTMRCFLSAGSNHPSMLSELVRKLKLLHAWFDDNDRLSFYASSILLIYDGAAKDNDIGHIDVRMIDFGHVRRSYGGDDGYKVGLTVLRSIMEELLQETGAQ
jgi:inositol-polyphosphate multikinase